MRLPVIIVSAILALFVCLPTVAAADPVGMVKDINPTGSSDAGPSLLPVGDVVYFAAADGVHGRELWRSDGTAAGTIMVRDVRKGAGGSDPLSLTLAGPYVYFTAKDGSHGRELWRTDGTAGGTKLVSDMTPGVSATNFDGPWAAMGTKLFFQAGGRLWVTDGSSVVKSLVVGSAYNLSPLNDRLYFTINGRLWRTDGTPAGTRKLRWSPPQINTMVATSRYLFIFSGGDMFQGPGNLYRTDGTQAGLKRLSPSGYEWVNQAHDFVVLNNRLLFQDGPDLWRSDGTVRGTKRIASLGGYVSDMQSAAGAVWFDVLPDGGGGYQIWRTGGTAASTVLFDAESQPRLWDGIVGLGSLVYWCDSSSGDWIVWASDGTSTGTSQVADLGTTQPWWMRASSSRLFFVADDGISGRELWSYHP